MAMSCPRSFALALAALAGGCSFANDSLLPSPTLTAIDPRGSDAPRPAAEKPPAATTAAPRDAALPPAGAGGAGVSRGSTTTTSTSTIGAAAPPGKVGTLRADLSQLQDEVAAHSGDLQRVRRELDELTQAEDGTVDGIETRLKSTTVRSDPQLSRELSQAQGQLVRINEGVARLNNIASWATSDAALASYVQQAVRAAANDPATSDGDRKLLVRLELDAGRAAAAVDQLVTRASGEIATRSLYLASAHRRLAALGPEVAAGQRAAQRAPEPPRSAAPVADATGRRPLVTIHFDRPDVAYEHELFGAIQKALDSRPGVAFDIVAVSAPGQAVRNAAAAERNVESVVHSLSSMGLPADRFRLSAATLADAAGDEVRIYVR